MMAMASARAQHTAAELFGVPKVPTQGRDRLLFVAIDLFYRHGFNAIGIDRVIADAGVSKTTFYKHFTSKDDLMVAAIERRNEWETQAWNRAVHTLAGDEPRAQLRALFQVMDVWFNDPAFGGCIFINAAAEFPNPHHPVHKIAADHKRAIRQQVRELAVQAGAMDPDTFADLYTLLAEGTLVMRQVHDRDDAARLALKAVDDLMATWLPEPVGG
jgi:AcrR family transcriptional regulator